MTGASTVNAARTRIGRVTLNDGGADLRVIDKPKSNEVIEHAIEWARELTRWTDPPSAFVAVAFWPSPEEPWRPSHTINWQTRDPDLPLPRLMRVAAELIAARAPALIAEDRVMRRLGYTRDDDPELAP
jgi:hypothetical protein